jgi:hypothetical protein
MKKLYFLFFTFLISSMSFGQVILTDDFSYADGSLITVSSGDWVNFSGTSGTLLVASGQAVVKEDNSATEDAKRDFSSISGSIYYGIDFTVDDLGSPYPNTGTDFEYFVMFSDGGTSNFRGRIDVVPPSGAGDFSVGISTQSGSSDATWPTDLTYGVIYRATVKYDQDTNQAQLWINASSSGDTSILGNDGTDPGLTITAFCFRQSDSDANETVRVDNLIVAGSFAEALSNGKNQIEGFSFSPNPTSLGYVNLTSKSQTTLNVGVYDILGKQVITTTVTNNRLDVSTLNTGIYVMKVSQDNASTTKKLVIK